MITFGTMMRTAFAAAILSGSHLQYGGLMAADARLASPGDFEAADGGIMTGALASRDLQQDVQVGDGEVTVDGSPVATLDGDASGGTVTTDDGSTVGFGPEGAGGELSDGTTGGVGDGGGDGELGGGVQTSEGTGVGVGTDGAGVETSGGTGVGVGADGAGASTGDGTGVSVSDDGVLTGPDGSGPAPATEEGDTADTASSTASTDTTDDGSPSEVTTTTSGAPTRLAGSCMPSLATAALVIAAAVFVA